MSSEPDHLPGEFAFIDWIRRQTAADSRIAVGIGDDTAAFEPPAGRQMLVTTDMILEGVHFERRSSTLREIGRKAMGVNLSDIAAMAGEPLAAVVAVAMPRDCTRSNAEELFHGIYDLAREFQVAVVGGDTNASSAGLVVCITVLGVASARGPVLRSGAKPSDWICVTGSLGGSIAGRQFTFTPRVREASLLHERFSLHAMIDISDGLAADLAHVLDESKCGAELEAAAIPISPDAHKLGGTATPLEHALHDGEDFELLFTLAPDDARRLLTEQPLPIAVSHIGHITAESRLTIIEANQKRRLDPKGFDHFRRSGSHESAH